MSFIGLIFSVLDNLTYSGYIVNANNYAGIPMVIVSIIFLLIGLPIYATKKTLIYIKINLKFFL
jgi:hypothetical protein